MPKPYLRCSAGVGRKPDVSLSGELEDAVRVGGHGQQTVVFADAQPGCGGPIQRGGHLAISDPAAFVDRGDAVQDVAQP